LYYFIHSSFIFLPKKTAVTVLVGFYTVGILALGKWGTGGHNKCQGKTRSTCEVNTILHAKIYCTLKHWQVATVARNWYQCIIFVQHRYCTWWWWWWNCLF